MRYLLRHVSSEILQQNRKRTDRGAQAFHVHDAAEGLL